MTVRTEGFAPGLDEAGFVVNLDRFSGPLDLLLHLIRREEIDIWDIPIARIADQFLAAIGALGLDEAAEYLEMAARLLRIKAQMLLPRRGDEEAWEDPRHELVRRLLEYQQIREVVDWMERAARRRSDRFARGYLPPAPQAPPPPLVFSLEELIAAVERVLAAIPDPVILRVAARPLDVEGATATVSRWLAERGSFSWREMLGERPTLVDVLSSLVALLELARRGTLTLTQPGAFSPVIISRGPAYEAA
ncbi:MAG TPA: segregation/condensation protein A [Gemmatimonadales bacterium]|nr:segregation/condensation protein A [Gemmatimonadales bacterium]